MTWHGSLPWGHLRRAYYQFRKLLFTKERSEGEYLEVQVGLQEVEQALGKQSYAPNWEFSYNYRSEDLNQARVLYERDPRHGPEWWQVHVRGWEHEDSLLLRGHWEPEPTEHPKPHLHGVGYDLERGMRALGSALHEEGIEWQRVEWVPES